MKASRSGLCRVALPLAALLLLAGCAGSSQGAAKPRAAAPKSSAPATAAPEAPVRPADPVLASALRERAIAVLENLARDPDPQIRANVIEAAGRAPGRLQRIIVAGLSDPNIGVRTVAAMTIARYEITELGALTYALLDDPSPYVKAAAIYAHVRCGLDVDQTPLADMLLRSPSPRVRAHAAFILGEIGNRSALSLLRQASREKLSRAAEGEIRSMQLQLAEAMVKLGDDSKVDAIRGALYPSRAEELEAVALAAQIIGQIRDHGAGNHLINLSIQRDPQGRLLPAEIRLAVAGSLARLGNLEADAIAEEYIADPAAPIRAQAAFVYGETGRARALSRLDTLLKDPDGSVQVAAAAAALRASQTVAGAR